MRIKQKTTVLLLSVVLVFTSIFVTPIGIGKVEAVSLTKQQAINKYYNFQNSYNNHEVPIIKGFEQQYDGSLAHQVVARAIWYMEHGYMIYNFAGGYPTNGLIDCSNFTQLVYRDFGINITSRSRDYDKVGTKVQGVSSVRVGTSSSGQALYGIQGIENLRPGDIMTYWAGSGSDKYISSVGIYLGVINGKPSVLKTMSNRPTALGIVNNFSHWYGSNFFEARRILPSDAWDPSAAHKYTDNGPVIPSNYYLPPQKPIVMPNNEVINNNLQHPTNSGSNSDGNQSVTGQVKVTNSSVNIRSGPGTNYTILGVVRSGDILDVIGHSGSWLNVRLSNGNNGFIADWLVSHYNSNQNNTDSNSPDILTSKVTGSVANVRAAASTNSSIIGVLRYGDEVVITGVLDGWYEVNYNDQKAYIANFLLSNPMSMTTSDVFTQTATVIGGTVNIRSAPGTSHNIVAITRRGDVVEVLSTSNEWVKVKSNNTIGYIANWLVSIN